MSIVLPRTLVGLSSQEEDMREVMMVMPVGVFQSSTQITTTSTPAATLVGTSSLELRYGCSID